MCFGSKAGVVKSYYVEKEGVTVIAGFIRNGSSGAPLSFDTTHFHIEGKEGSWLAFDSIIIDGRQFFLMEHEIYGKEAASPHSRWKLRRIWSVDGSKERGKYLACAAGCFFFYVLNSGEFLCIIKP